MEKQKGRTSLSLNNLFTDKSTLKNSIIGVFNVSQKDWNINGHWNEPVYSHENFYSFNTTEYGNLF